MSEESVMQSNDFGAASSNTYPANSHIKESGSYSISGKESGVYDDDDGDEGNGAEPTHSPRNYSNSKTLGDVFDESDKIVEKLTEALEMPEYDDEGNKVETPDILKKTDDRPDYLMSNFKSTEDQAKAYKNLHKSYQKTLSKYDRVKKYFGAPEGNEYKIPLDESDKAALMKHAAPIVRELETVAKEHNFSQEMFNSLFDRINNHVSSQLHNSTMEIEELDDGEARVKTMQNWMRNNFNVKEFPTLNKIPLTKDMVLFFEQVKSRMTGNSNMPNSMPTMKPIRSETPEDLRKELMENMDLVKNDPGYMDQVKRRLSAMSQGLQEKYRVRV